MADPGFPVGGGGVDLLRGHFLVKMYAKMKELGPMGGRAPGTPPPDPPMTKRELGKLCYAVKLENGNLILHVDLV